MQRETSSSPARDTPRNGTIPMAMAEPTPKRSSARQKKVEWDCVPMELISTFPAMAACFDLKMRIRTGWLTDRRNAFLELGQANMAAMRFAKGRKVGFISSAEMTPALARNLSARPGH